VPRRERFLVLSGLTFAPLFLIGWFASAGITPHYGAPNQDWVKWAHDNQWRGRISSFAMLLAFFFFLYFMGSVRSVLARAESPARGSAQLARVAFAGAVTGMAAMAMAIVVIGAAATNGAGVDPVVSKAVATGAAGPFLVAAASFASFLMAVALLTLRSEILARWTGMVALVGAVCFLITFLVVLDGTTDGSKFGYAFFPALVSLAVWTVATSLAKHRPAAAAHLPAA
jgi:hypothetical protein